MNCWGFDYEIMQSETEPYLYFYDHDGEFFNLLLYVGDILSATKNKDLKINSLRC